MTFELYCFVSICILVGATHLALYVEDRIKDLFDRE